MVTLIIGGSASGKSEYAEEVAMACGARPRTYVATMEAWDQESKKRVERHRAMRADKEFATVERPLDLAGMEPPDGGVTLVECVSNLVANEMFSPGGAGQGAGQAVVRGLEKLRDSVEHLVIVTNDVFLDGVEYDEGTARYLQALGQVNAALGRMAGRVVEVVCGIPIVRKGDG